MSDKPFLADVQMLRNRAQRQIADDATVQRLREILPGGELRARKRSDLMEGLSHWTRIPDPNGGFEQADL